MAQEKDTEKKLDATENRKADKMDDIQDETCNTTQAKSEEVDETQYDVRFILEPSGDKTVKKVVVFIEGKFNIYSADFSFRKLHEIFAQYDIVDFKLRNIEEFDLSAIQTLYYFQYFLSKLEKRITLQIEELPQEIMRLLVKTKYNDILLVKPANG